MMRLLNRVFTATLTTATTGATEMTENTKFRAFGHRSDGISQVWHKLLCYVDGAIADEIEVLSEWYAIIRVQGKVICTMPLSRCAAVQPTTTPDGGAAAATLALPVGEGVLGDILVTSEEGSVSISLEPAPWSAAPAPGADTVVGLAIVYTEVQG